MFKRTLFLLALGLVFTALIGCGNNAADPGDAAAVVNEKVITVGDLDIQMDNTIEMYGIDLSEQDDEYIQMIRQHALDGLITEILLVDAAQSYTASEEDVNEEYERIKADFETEEQFNDALAAADLTTASLKEQIEQNLKIDQFFFDKMSEVNVTDDELEELFAQFSEFEEEKLDFEEMKPLLEQSLIQQKQEEEVAKVIQQLKDDAAIEILI